MAPPLHLVPLGGLGEIGMNCMAFELGDDIVVVDCGVMFPDRELGVDVIHPDFEWLLRRRDRVRAVILTHGHEDHIGALPYLLREIPLPVYGPRYALELARHRLAEHEREIGRNPELVPIEPRRSFRVGGFEIEPVRVTHSIVDAVALVLRTAAGTVVHTGDFKIEDDPVDGERFDAERLREIGDLGVRLLLSDSTNAWVDGRTGAERDVHRALDPIVAAAPHRVVVTLFASNVHRLKTLLALARAHGRRVLLLGRSIRRHVEVATATGYLRDPSSLLVDEERARDLPRDRLLVLATGTQGEPRAAMARLASDRHPALDLEPGDEVIFSSRIIPGHEQAVYGMINDLERRGLTVRFRATDPGVHVSGHAHREEQRTMLELLRPRSFLPLHGTLMHLKRHEELARQRGVEDTLVVENGAVVQVHPEGLRVVDQAPTGRVHVDAGDEIPPEVLRDRALLAELGIALVVVQVDRSGHLAATPDVFMRGVVAEEEEVELVEEARTFVEDSLGARKRRDRWDDEEIEDRARRALKRFLGRALGRKPLTHGIVIRVPR